jgi:hypothetical protein
MESESFDRPYEDQPEGEPGEPPPTTDLDDHATDPAFEAVEEAGGGVSEGQEVAEGQLVENIEGAPPADQTPDGADEDDLAEDEDSAA